MGATVRAYVAVASFACVSVASAADVGSGVSDAAATTPAGTPGATNTASTGAATSDTGAAPQGYVLGTIGRPKNFFNYGADVGIGYSDNISETSVDKRSDQMVGLGVQLEGLNQSARFQGAVLADLEHVNYLQGTFSPQLIGNFAGSASYALVPDFLHWMAQDNFGQGLIDPFASQSPGNVESINTFTTGPTFTVPLGTLTMLSLSARYSRVSYQVSPLDNNDYGGALSLTHLLSARSRISFNIQDERYAYTDPINPSYSQREAYLRYDIQGARTRITVDLGYDQVRGSQVDSSGSMARLTISRTLAPGSVLSLTAGRDPSNSSSFVTQSQAVSGIGLQTTSGIQTATPFVNQYATLGWSFIRRRTTLNLSVSHFQQLYDGQSNLDQTVTGGGIHVSRVVYPGWSVGVFADYSKNKFAAQIGGNYTEEHGGATVKWQMARKLALTFEYDHYNRDSQLALYSYAENRVWVRVQYGTLGPGGAMTGGGEASSLGVTNTDRFNIPMPTH